MSSKEKLIKINAPSGGCGFKSSGSNFEKVVPGWDAQGEHGTRKLLFLIAVPALTLVSSAPSYAGAYHHGHYHPDYGGHAGAIAPVVVTFIVFAGYTTMESGFGFVVK